MTNEERRTTFKISSDLDDAFRKWIDKRHGTIKTLVVKSIDHGIARSNDDDFCHLLQFATPKARNANDYAQISIHLPVETMTRIDGLAASMGSDRAQFIETSILSYCVNNFSGFELKRDYPFMYFSRLKADGDSQDNNN